MADNEIIKALEYCQHDITYCDKCYFLGKGCIASKSKYALDLINRQMAEIEKFKNRQKPTAASGYKIENGKVVFFTNMLGGCKVVKENLDEVVKTLNELLQECYSKDEIAFALKCKTEELKTAKAEAVKEFAEILNLQIDEYISKQDTTSEVGCEVVEYLKYLKSDIGDYLKELVGETNV